jgi:DNA-binding response OmpR family regulator
MEHKILIVDDESFIRRLIEQSLEDLEDDGVKLLTASNGEEAIATIETERPRLVLLDVMMPGMNGFDVCTTIKSKLKYNDVYIILLTAQGQEYDKHRGKMAGADTYITKPFDPDQLLAKASSVLGI